MIGRTLGHYQIVEQLGEGNMGVVYKARDRELDRYVALKVLHRRLASSPEFIARFEREAKVISALNHPNIATIYGVSQADGLRFLILEYLPGGTLRLKLQKLAEGERFPILDVVQFALQVAEGLAHAHRRGVVHRDVKTDNVMLTEEGVLKVTDFGVAKIEMDLGLTEEGSVVGTMAYMSPEQVQGVGVDFRSDIYSFGVVVYELATGQLPFPSYHSAALIYDVVNSAPPAIAQFRDDVPPALERVVGECLRKQPEQRPASMGDIAVILESLRGELRSGSTASRHDRPRVAEEPAGLAAGRLLGHYRLEARIGEGGMGVVYRARDTRLDRPVALKVLSAQAVANTQRKKRFVQEAKAASALNHPNIVTIHDISESDGYSYIAMEYIAGKTLDRLIAGNGLPLGEALRYAVQTADALAMAHASGIVHRDIKPANVMITPDGLVKLLDFGLAKLTEPLGEASPASGDLSAQTPRTEEGVILGTVAYMSPEQAEGKAIDARSDIFSFGSLLFEMVTGRRAFQGESKISVLAAILHQEPPAVRELSAAIPGEVERTIIRCLRKDPNRRSQHMADIKVALQESLEEWNSTHASAPAQRALPESRRRRLDPRSLAAGFFAAAILLAVLAWLRPSSEPGTTNGAGILASGANEIMLTRLSGSERLAVSASWSPDGTWICYASDRAGNLDIWKRPLLGGDEVQLTTTSQAETQPAWAPDGRKIAFAVRGREGGIFLIPADGGRPARVTTFGSNPSWSPDGQTLAFDWNGGVYVVPYAGGEPRLLAAGTSATPHTVWSPDASQIVFWSRTQGDLLSMRLADGVTAPLGLIAAGEEVAGLSWSFDGRWLLFSRGSFGGNKDLWRVAVDPQTAKPLGEPVRLTLSSTDDVQCRISADGTKIAFTAQQVERHLWSFPQDSRTGLLRGEAERITRAGERNYYPAVSLDGQTLIWTSQNAGQGMLYYRTLGDGQERKLTAERGRGIREVGASFAPDGVQIAYSSTVGGSYQLWRMPSLDSVALQLTRTQQPVRDTQTAWSPDGQRIAFYSTRSGNWDIWTIAPSGSDEPRQLTNWESNEVYPSWSPDSSRLAFVSDHEGNPDIWILDLNTNQLKAAVQNPAEEGPAVWSPDGKWIYFSSNRSGEFNIWKMPAAGGEPEQVTHYEGSGSSLPETALFTKFAVTATRLIVPLESREGGIYVLESFAKE
jgi:serine/threonine protein kinase/Tol biopolymer transport system component